MPEFTSLEDLAKYVGSSLFLGNQEMEAILIQEAARLEGYLKEEINDYYNSYSPVVYVRTYDWINSIRVSDPELEGSIMRIRIYFDDSMALHPSVISSNQPDGYVPWLMDRGWHISQTVQPRRNRFTDFAGTGYITKAVQKYNNTNPYGFVVSIESDYE